MLSSTFIDAHSSSALYRTKKARAIATAVTFADEWPSNQQLSFAKAVRLAASAAIVVMIAILVMAIALSAWEITSMASFHRGATKVVTLSSKNERLDETPVVPLTRLRCVGSPAVGACWAHLRNQ